jgi:hypothetical protein
LEQRALMAVKAINLRREMPGFAPTVMEGSSEMDALAEQKGFKPSIPSKKGWHSRKRRSPRSPVSAVSTISKRRTLRPVYGYPEARERRRKHMRGRPGSVRSLEELGRVRLSASFFMRDFLHSEIADFHSIPNIPDDPDLAIAAGRKLCEQVLEPLQATFGPALTYSGRPSDVGEPSGARRLPNLLAMT